MNEFRRDYDSLASSLSLYIYIYWSSIACICI